MAGRLAAAATATLAFLANQGRRTGGRKTECDITYLIPNSRRVHAAMQVVMIV
jgi:hypothetical protein